MKNTTFRLSIIILLLSSSTFCNYTYSQKNDIEFIGYKDMPYSETAGLRPYKNSEGKWGYVNEKEKIVILAQFTKAKPFDNSSKTAVVNVNSPDFKGIAVIDMEGNIIVKPTGFVLSLNYWGNNLWKFSSPNKKTHESDYGLINRENKIVLAKEYSYIQDYSEGTNHFLIKKGVGYSVKCGKIDNNGLTVLPCEFTKSEYDNGKFDIYAGQFTSRGGSAFKIGSGWINETPYSGIGKFTNDMIPIMRDNLKGYIDSEGKEHWLESKYDKKFKEVNGYAQVQLGDKYGFVNSKDEIVIPIEYEACFDFFKTPRITGVQKNGKQGYINYKNEVIIPIENDNVFEPKNGMIKIKKNGKFAYCNTAGKQITNYEFDKANDFKKDYAIVQKGEKYGAINKEGDVIVSIIYDFVDSEFSEGLLGVKKGELWGFINKSNEVVIPFKYNSVTRFFSDQSRVKDTENGIHYVINTNGEVTAKGFDQADYILITQSKYRVIYKKNGLFGTMDETGKIIIPATWTATERNNQGDYEISSSHGIGILNYGEVIIPPIMDEIKYTDFGFYIVKKGNFYGLYHTSKGEVIGLMLNDLYFNYLYKNYSYEQRTREVTKKGKGTISSYDDNAWAKFKTDGQSINSVAIFNPSTYIYVLNDTEYSQMIYQREKGVSGDRDAKEYLVKKGELLKLACHNTGDVYHSTGYANGTSSIANAKKILVLQNSPENCGTVIKLTDFYKP